MCPKWGMPLAAKSHSDTGASPASRSVNKRPLPETFSTSTAWLEGFRCWSWSKRAITESCQVRIRDALAAEPVTPLALIPCLRGAQQEVLQEASWSSEELTSVQIQQPDEPGPIPGLACLTNAALKPKTLKLLPHVKKSPKLQAISTASVRLGKDNQENGA